MPDDSGRYQHALKMSCGMPSSMASATFSRHIFRDGSEQETHVSEDQVLENRLRRTLQRRGYRLMKSRRRDVQAIDYGGYMIIDASMNAVVDGGSPYPYSMSLEQVVSWVDD